MRPTSERAAGQIDGEGRAEGAADKKEPSQRDWVTVKMDLRVGTELTCPVGRPLDRLDRSEGKGEADRIEWNYPALDRVG